MTLRIVTYEGGSRTPVLEHVFHGSKKEIYDVIRAHRKSDAFFRAATDQGGGAFPVTWGTFQGIDLRSTWHWT